MEIICDILNPICRPFTRPKGTAGHSAILANVLDSYSVNHNRVLLHCQKLTV